MRSICAGLILFAALVSIGSAKDCPNNEQGGWKCCLKQRGDWDCKDQAIPICCGHYTNAQCKRGCDKRRDGAVGVETAHKAPDSTSCAMGDGDGWQYCVAADKFPQ